MMRYVRPCPVAPLRRCALLLWCALAPLRLSAQSMAGEIDARTNKLLPSIVQWRRDIHQHPELSNRETRTAKLVADHLTRLGMEVRTGVAHTGVVGVLRGGKPGPVVALRADMDGLPVTELADVPFKSVQRATYNGQSVGVMHACGHDNHVAILMGVAELLAGMKANLPGSVKFIFQPAEEGAPLGENGGAKMMVEQGVLENPVPGAIFGLHVWPDAVGTIATREGPMMAAADGLSIVVRGRQTHGAVPWGGVDPIVIASQIVLALQTIPSRQINITTAPAVVTLGTFQGGTRGNIIPDSVVMTGTVRTFDEAMRADIKLRIRRTAESIAQSAGATATVSFIEPSYPVTVNDRTLTNAMLPSLRRVVGEANVKVSELSMPAEDFSYFQHKVPGLFLFLGVTPKDKDPVTAPRNHSPYFFADEGALPIGVRALATLAIDWLAATPPKP